MRISDWSSDVGSSDLAPAWVAKIRLRRDWRSWLSRVPIPASLTRRPRPTRRNAFRPKTAIGPILAGTRRGGNNSLEGEPVVQPVVEPRRGKALACTGQNLAGEMCAKIPDVGIDDDLPLLLIGG